MFKVNDNYLKLPGSYLFPPSVKGKRVFRSTPGQKDHPSGNRRCDAAFGTCHH